MDYGHKTAAVVLEIPDGVEDVEWIIELGLLRVVLHGEETRIAEVDPCNHSQTEDTIARRTLIDVQYQTRVKELFNTNMISQLHVYYLCSIIYHHRPSATLPSLFRLAVVKSGWRASAPL